MAEHLLTTTVTETTTTTPTTTIPPTLELISSAIGDSFVHYLNKLDQIPGGQIILRYIRSSYKNDPVRSLFELALFVFAVHYFLLSKRKENKSEIVKFSKLEIDELIKDWEPEPLVEEVNSLEKWQLSAIPKVKGYNKSHITLYNEASGNNISTNVVNLASYDFLDLNENENVHKAAKYEISNAGVGACGPPNFYGTQDVHVRLEEDLARFLQTEQSILYGQDFVTAGSVIPAYLKRGDLCIVDSGVNLAIQKALIVSRCNIEWYEHNDVDHLESILEELKPTLDKEPIRRRFIVTEGLFLNTGDICNLPRIVELKNKFKYRLFLDETLSIGVLGANGRGVVEHYNLSRLEISITIGTFAGSFASSGGFCAGVKPMVHHQRINSNAYTFSASLPPYSAIASSQSIKEIMNEKTAEGSSKLISQLHERTSHLYSKLTSIKTTFFKVTSNSNSPIIHISLSHKYRKALGLPAFYGNTHFLNTGKQARNLNEFSKAYNIESFLLQKIIDGVLSESNILITRSKTILDHENLPVISPQLLIMVNSGISLKELDLLAQTLEIIVNKVCKSVSNEARLLSLEDELLKYNKY